MKNFFILPFLNLFSEKNLSLDVIFFSILVILLPFALLTGPALPDIFISLVAIYFLIKSLIYKKLHYYKNPIFIGFLFFSIYGIFRSLFYESAWLSLSNEGSLFYFRYIFFVLGVWYLLDCNKYLVKCLFIVSLICFLIICLDGISQHFSDITYYKKNKFESRLTILFWNEPILGRYISYMSIFVFFLIYENFQKTKITIVLSIVLLVIAEITIFLSGERAPFFNIILFNILCLIFIPNYKIYRLFGIFLSAIIIFSILNISTGTKNRMIDQTIDQVSQNKLPYMPYSPHHEAHYISSIKMFLDNPFFGIGTNTFRFECKKIRYQYEKQSCSSHPHNYYIQILAEMGIFGFLAIIAFFFYLSYFILRQFFFLINNTNQKNIPFNIILSHIVLFVYWWPLIPHMSFYNNWNNVFMMLPLGFLMKYLYGNKANNTN